MAGFGGKDKLPFGHGGDDQVDCFFDRKCVFFLYDILHIERF
jgi:hypothetical protein